ncbi:MAG: C-terminal binding protein, partial [Candidatus Binatia bacterium]
MTLVKVVVTDHLFSSMDDERGMFGAMGAELVEGQCRDEAETIALSRDADAILNTYAPLSEKVIHALEKCR